MVLHVTVVVSRPGHHSVDMIFNGLTHNAVDSRDERLISSPPCAAVQVVGLLVYTGTIFIYRLIFVRFYVPRELEVWFFSWQVLSAVTDGIHPKRLGGGTPAAFLC